MREVVLDTETTGLDPAIGHRVIEIGCVEISDRRLTGNHFHIYLKPDREMDPEAVKIHGITSDFLADKPQFVDVAADFLDFVRGARLVIHNAPFDVGFLNHELRRSQSALGTVEDHCSVLDTLSLAKSMFPGQRATLDALCKRYGVDNSRRELHGALLDAEILADVYLMMTSGQESLALESALQGGSGDRAAAQNGAVRVAADRPRLAVRYATGAEVEAHEHYLEMLDSASGGEDGLAKAEFLKINSDPGFPSLRLRGQIATIPSQNPREALKPMRAGDSREMARVLLELPGGVRRTEAESGHWGSLRHDLSWR